MVSRLVHSSTEFVVGWEIADRDVEMSRRLSTGSRRMERMIVVRRIDGRHYESSAER
jgi:hypothetical protein